MITMDLILNIGCDKILTPDKNKLYPLFNEDGDLISFSREFNNGDIRVFEVYTKDFIRRYEYQGESWEKIKEIKNPIGKIPSSGGGRMV